LGAHNAPQTSLLDISGPRKGAGMGKGDEGVEEKGEERKGVASSFLRLSSSFAPVNKQ